MSRCYNDENLEMIDIEGILDIKTVYPVIKSLLDKNIILVAEQVHEKYKFQQS